MAPEPIRKRRGWVAAGVDGVPGSQALGRVVDGALVSLGAKRLGSDLGPETPPFVRDLVEKGVIAVEQVQRALLLQRKRKPLLGEIAVAENLMTPSQVFEVISRQSTERRPFGQLAVGLGILRGDELMRLLSLQVRRTPTLEDLLVELGALDEKTMRWERARFDARARTAAPDDDITQTKRRPPSGAPLEP